MRNWFTESLHTENGAGKYRQSRLSNAPKYVEYLETRHCFAWQTYPVRKSRAFGVRKDRMGSENEGPNRPDGRTASAETEVRETWAVRGKTLTRGSDGCLSGRPPGLSGAAE